MKSKNSSTDYWFIIEPFVFIVCTDKGVLLYNTIDGVILKSEKIEVIQLIKEILQECNYGVVFLENDRYNQKNIYDFISILREKYMGDIVDVSLSSCKPVQLLPYCNYWENQEVYKKLNFSSDINLLKNLYEITVHIDANTQFLSLISFLKSITSKTIINLVLDTNNYCGEFLNFIKQKFPENYILCSCEDVVKLYPMLSSNILYKLSVNFPINRQLIDDTIYVLKDKKLLYECIFNVSSEKDYKEVKEFVNHFNLHEYRLNPVYTGDNISFFEDYVFLTEDDILSTSMTMKDFFLRTSINVYDFGKINIMPNGDVYANLNYPVLGNIKRDNIYKIVQNEINWGKSWFRIRNQSPCRGCIYQWLCPSPSNCEITIGRPNLCHVKP